jgi:hypothetical protein
MARNSVTPRLVRITVCSAAAAAILVLGAHSIDAHKGITSKYTYDDDVYPILRDKCGRCHTDGGPTPMSLLNYNSDNGGAVAWATSIREMLQADAMPPWYADPIGPAVRNGNHGLTPHELDIILTWSSGGTPQGDLHKKPVTIPLRSGWSLGKPDLELPMPDAHTLAAGVMDDILEVTLPTKNTETKWVKAADLLPGTPAIVRRASISVTDGPLLALWQPGDDTTEAPSGAAFKLPAGATIHLRVYYKKGWQDEQQSKTDKSTVGLYFTEEPLSGKSLQSVSFEGGGGENSRTFGGAMSAGGRVVAIRPLVDQAYTSMDINAITSSGRKVTLLKLRGPRPEWPRRYWLADPIELAAGTKIEIKTVPGDPELGPLQKTNSPLQVSFDIVPQ